LVTKVPYLGRRGKVLTTIYVQKSKYVTKIYTYSESARNASVDSVHKPRSNFLAKTLIWVVRLNKRLICG
jgi:hypothetical protein